MNTLFLPCAGGVESYLAEEIVRICGDGARDVRTARGGVQLLAGWPEVMKLNLHSRLAQRVLVQLAHRPYRTEQDVYEAASALAWEEWFSPRDLSEPRKRSSLGGALDAARGVPLERSGVGAREHAVEHRLRLPGA